MGWKTVPTTLGPVHRPGSYVIDSVGTWGTKVPNKHGLGKKLKECLLISGKYSKIDAKIYNKKQIFNFDPPIFDILADMLKFSPGNKWFGWIFGAPCGYRLGCLGGSLAFAH